MVPLVLAGAGAAVLPRRLAVDAVDKGARVCSLDPPLRRSVHVIWRKGRASALALAFAEHCVRACATDRGEAPT